MQWFNVPFLVLLLLCQLTLNFYIRTTSLVDALYWINDALNCLALAIISELYYLACCSFWSMMGFSSLTVWRIMCESVQVINLRHVLICYKSTTRSLPRAARRDIYYRGMTPIYYGCATSDQFLTCTVCHLEVLILQRGTTYFLL